MLMYSPNNAIPQIVIFLAMMSLFMHGWWQTSNKSRQSNWWHRRAYGRESNSFLIIFDLEFLIIINYQLYTTVRRTKEWWMGRGKKADNLCGLRPGHVCNLSWRMELQKNLCGLREIWWLNYEVTKWSEQ